MNNNFLEKLRIFYYSHKRMPSLSEARDIFGFKSRNSAVRVLHNMVIQNILKKDQKGKHVPGSLFYSLKVLGAVEAGWPSPAEEELTDTLSLEEWLIGNNKDATYILKVKGDSMKDAGILPDDMVLVERTKQAKDGDIVIAEVDREWTMKYLKKSGRRVWLMPANKNYSAIYPKEELKIAAIVKAVIRKYK